MKTLLLFGAALLGLCTPGQTAQAGSDDYDYSYRRPAPEVYEGRVIERHYCPPPPPPVYYAPAPVVYGYAYPRYSYHRRHYVRPYGYGYRYTPGIHIGIGF